MKRFLLSSVLMLLLVGSVLAQSTLPSPMVRVSPNIYTGQMLNTAKVYGTLQDTATNTTALPLYICKKTTEGVVTSYPVIDNGTLSILAECTKITGTLTGTVTLEQSFNNVNWGPVTYLNSTDTASIPVSYPIADVSTMQTITFNLPLIYASAYYRVVFRGVGTATSLWKSYFGVRTKI